MASYFYNPEVQKKSEVYVAGGFKDNEEVIPTKEGLAEILGVNEDTITNWSKKTDEMPKFGATIALLEQKQKRLLKSKALQNKWNARTAIFILNADHGMKEHTENTIVIDREVQDKADKATKEFLENK